MPRSIVPMALMPYAFFRNEITPLQNAVVSITSNSLKYGTSCFSGVRGFVQDRKIKIFRLQDHYKRLINGAKITGINIDLTWDYFLKSITDLVKANGPKEHFYLRPTLFSEDPVLTPRFDLPNFQLAIYMTLLGPYFDPTRGLRVQVSSWRKISDNAISTKAKLGGAYTNTALAITDALRNGYDDALLMDDQGCIVEATSANIFLVYRGEVISPEIGMDLLEGITRRTCIELLAEEGIKVKTDRIDRSMAYTCDELIITGTAVQLAYVHSVDDRIIVPHNAPSPIYQLLMKKMDQVIAGKHPKSSLWLTEIH